SAREARSRIFRPEASKKCAPSPRTISIGSSPACADQVKSEWRRLRSAVPPSLMASLPRSGLPHREVGPRPGRLGTLPARRRLRLLSLLVEGERQAVERPSVPRVVQQVLAVHRFCLLRSLRVDERRSEGLPHGVVPRRRLVVAEAILLGHRLPQRADRVVVLAT